MAFSSHNNSLCKCNLVLFRPASANADCCTPLFWFEVIVAANVVNVGDMWRQRPAATSNVQKCPTRSQEKHALQTAILVEHFLTQKSQDPKSDLRLETWPGFCGSGCYDCSWIGLGLRLKSKMFPMLPQLHLSEVKKQAEAEGLDKIFIEAMTRSHQALRSLEILLYWCNCGHNVSQQLSR